MCNYKRYIGKLLYLYMVGHKIKEKIFSFKNLLLMYLEIILQINM